MVLVVAVVAVVFEVTLIIVLLVVVVVVVTVGVVRALVCAGAVGDVIIIVSDMAVVLLMDVLTGIMRGLRTNIDVGVLVDVNVNVCAGEMIAFDFAISSPLEKFRRRAAFDCRPMAALDCIGVLHAWMPSYHV